MDTLLKKSQAIKDENKWRKFMLGLSDQEFCTAQNLQEDKDLENGSALLAKLKLAIEKVLEPERKKLGEHHFDAAMATVFSFEDADAYQNVLSDLGLCYEENVRGY
jgi:hypothetical protein